MNKIKFTLLLLFCLSMTFAQTSYEDDVLPIFEVKCASCHGIGGGGLNVGLDITSETAILEGSNSGEVVVLGDYENSILYQRITGDGGYMPPSWTSNEILDNEEVSVVVSWILGLNDGCTDENALNYDPGAINDDGSCEYAPWDVLVTDCSMTIALPSNLSITLDGEIVTEPIWIGVANTDGVVSGSSLYTPGEVSAIAIWQASGGDPGLTGGETLNWVVSYNGIVGVATVNYDTSMFVTDGTYSCNGMASIDILTALSEQILIDGCTDSFACNYNSEATTDDGSCIYITDTCDECSGETDGSGTVLDGDTDNDGVCNNDEIFGCTDSESCTFNENATEDDGSCQYLDDCGVCGGDDTACLGCTDENSCNYGGASITIDDGSCEYTSCAGCTDFEACNFNPDFTIDDDSCDYSCLGCTDSTACNYDPDATLDNGSCEFISCVGCTDPNACNYNPDSLEDDGSCEYTSCVGCLDDFACNYDETASISCYLEGQEIEGFTYLSSFNNSSYYVSEETYSWTDANNLCNLSGGTLVVFDSQEENDFIGSLSVIDPNEPYWIGVFQNTNSPNYSEPDGGWELVTGEELIYENWQVNEPNEAANQGENYAVWQFDFGWNDTPNADIENIGTPRQAILEIENCCEYVDDICETCEDGVVVDNDEDDDDICDNDEIPGCLDSLACNYNENATDDDESCIYVNTENSCGYCSGETDGTGVYVVNDSDSDGLCDDCNENVADCDIDPCPEDSDNDTNNNGVWDCEEITGCTDPSACNYNEDANVDDLTCFYPDGCTDSTACNYDPDALCDDGTCILPDGCTNLNSCNYDVNALCDDGSCTSLTEDDSCLVCTDPTACNYVDVNGVDFYTIENNSTCTFDSCCNEPSATNYDPNCECVDNALCFTIPDGCDFDCFTGDDGIFPIPVISSYGAYQISCSGGSDGVLGIDFNTMNLVSDGVAPYSVQVYQQFDSNGDGTISIDEEVFIGTLDENNSEFNNLTAGDYVLIAYDLNGCCGQTLVSMNQPGENTLTISDYDPILCPGGQTEIDFIIEGSVGQFDVLIDNVSLPENTSIEGGTVIVDTNDADGDGFPDGFVQLNGSYWDGIPETFWPDLYNECDGVVNTIYINIENSSGIDDGDLIGAFYTTGEGSLQCFGYNEYVSSTSGSSLITIPICEGDENGFNNGEEVVFLVFDSSEGVTYEVNVSYEYNNEFGVFSDVFTFDSTYDGLWISSLNIVGVSGNVPDFTIIAEEGSYNIQVNRSDSIDSNNDGILDDAFICLVVDTTINVVDPDPMIVNISSGGSACNYLDDNGGVQSTPGGYIEINDFSGGTAPYIYSWYDSDSNIIEQSFINGIPTIEDFDGDGLLDDLDFLPSGFYALNVEDANGCFFDTIIDLSGSDLQLSSLIVNSSLIACSGGTTTVELVLNESDNAPYTFTWSTSLGDLILSTTEFNGIIEIFDVEEGLYTATVTDSFGCQIINDVDIDVNPSGQIAIFNPLIELVCGEDDAYVNFANCPNEGDLCIANGTPPFNYTFYIVEDLNGNGVLEFGTNEYSSAGWSGSTDISVPEATLLFDNDGDQIFDTYSFFVEDASGCEGEYFFTLVPPEPIEFEPAIDSIICYGDSATISLELVTGNPGLYDFIFQGDTTTITIGGASELDFYIDDDTGMFDDAYYTDVNATLLFFDDAASIFTENDTIGVFYTGENGITCGGSIVYQNETVFNIPVWGNDSSTPEDDGFVAGETILILVNSGGIVYQVDILDFDINSDSPFTYIPNGTSAISDAQIGNEFSQGPNFITEPLSEGDYFIEVVDGNQCYWSDFISIEGVDEYSLSGEVNNPTCDLGGSGEIIVDVFGGTVLTGYSFIWTGPSNFSSADFGFSTTLSDLSPGEYTLIVFDDNECLLSEVFVVEVDVPEPTISIINELCGDDGSIETCVDWQGEVVFNYSNGSLSDSFTLINDTGGEICYVFDNLAAGNYNLSISSGDDDSGCFYEQFDLAIEEAAPFFVQFETEPATCYNGTGSIWIEVLEGGNPPYSIDWEGIDTYFAPVGEHQFTITDDSGCSYSQSYFIANPPVVSIDFSLLNNTCFEESEGAIEFVISGGNDSQYTYEVYGPNSLENIVLSGTGSSGALSSLVSGVYTFSIEDGSECEFVFAQEISSEFEEIVFENVDNQNTAIGIWELDETVPGDCFGENGVVYLNILNADNSNYLYHWYELPDGEEEDWDGDGLLNSDPLETSVDGGVFISNQVSYSDQVSLPAGFYYVFVESVSDACLSDIVLFEIETPDVFNVSIDDVNLSCQGELASPISIISGGNEEDIDGDGLVNNDIFGNWIDPDIDGDGLYDLDGNCISNCNDDDDDIDNDGIHNPGPDGILYTYDDECVSGCNNDDDYIGGTLYNGLSTVYDPLIFSNGLVFEVFENGNWVEFDASLGLSGGTYRAYATDSNGCYSNMEEFVVFEPFLLEIAASYDYNALGSSQIIIHNPGLDGVLYNNDDEIEPINLLCFGDSVAIVAEPFGGSPPYVISCVNNLDEEVDLQEEMLSSGEYQISVYDSEQCQQFFNFTILPSPPQISINADLDNDGISGELNYNNFHVSCNGASDGEIQFLVPENSGTPPFSIDIYLDNNIVSQGDYVDVQPNSLMMIDNLPAGFYDFLITDANTCVSVETIELIQPDEFSPDIEYIINASCDEETDGMIIIRTNGGNPPFEYVINSSSDVYTTQDSLLVVYEDDYLVDDVIVEEILITESDILLSNLPGNSWHTVSVINDDYGCLEFPVGYSLYVGSDDSDCLFIPSVFTPNGDGINDTWEMDGIDLYSDVTIKVFNRWGQVVYESEEGSYVPWDGVSQLNDADQEIATYYYVIDLNIEGKTYNGSVTIKR